MSQIYVTLLETGLLMENFHYGPFSRYWWKFSSISNSHTLFPFPIRVGQKTNAFLNGCDFYITIRTSGQMPEYYCQSGDFSVIETSATKTIFKIYQNIFKIKSDILVILLLDGITKT